MSLSLSVRGCVVSSETGEWELVTAPVEYQGGYAAAARRVGSPELVRLRLDAATVLAWHMAGGIVAAKKL